MYFQIPTHRYTHEVSELQAHGQMTVTHTVHGDRPLVWIDMFFHPLGMQIDRLLCVTITHTQRSACYALQTASRVVPGLLFGCDPVINTYYLYSNGTQIKSSTAAVSVEIKACVHARWVDSPFHELQSNWAPEAIFTGQRQAVTLGLGPTGPH